MEIENTLKQDMLESLPFIAFFLTPNYKIVWANQMCRDFMGLSNPRNPRIPDQDCYMIWRLGKPCSGCPMHRAMETGISAEFILPDPEQTTWPDTQGKWKLHLIPVKSGMGVSGILEIAYEITPEQQARQALRKSQARLRLAQKLAQIGHWELDFETNELFWSDEIFNIFEIDRRRFGASYDAFIAATHPDDRDKIHAAYTASLENKTPYKIEHRLLLSDGRIKYVQERCKTYYDSQGKELRSLGTVQDITARKMIEEENEKLQQQFLQAQKMESIGCLAGGVAHDYNNISGIIMGYSELALEQLDPADPMYEYFTEIFKAAKKSSEITRQLLAFARQQTIAPKVLYLNETLIELLKMLGRLVGEDIEILFLPGAEIWPVKVDPTQFDQIMANLCVNARDSITDVGKVTIEMNNVAIDDAYCRIHLGAIPGEYVLISVSDDGCGIAPENMGKVFEPFFTTKSMGKGTGLGLATVYGIVKQNNGFINVYSELGTGTVFKIYLPRHLGDIENDILRESAEIPQGRGETILFVEDDPSILKLGNRILSQLGYTVLAAGGPNDAIQTVNEYTGTIDLLVTDVVMPEMNGRVLSEQLLEIFPRMKVLFVSGYTANVIADRGVLQKRLFFLSKPFSRKELAGKVREVLSMG